MFTPLSAKRTLKGSRMILPGEDTLCLVIRSTSTGLDEYYHFNDFLKKHWRIEENLHMNISIALSEAVQNAAIHGNRSSFWKKVSLTATRDEDYYAFTIEDEGLGFDHRRVKDPLENDHLLRPGGRGIFLMRQLCDYVYFSNGGKCVKLLFYRKR